MPPPSFLSLFPQPRDLLALTPEDLGGVIIEAVSPLIQNGMFTIDFLLNSLYQIVGPSYPPGTKTPVSLAFAEAISWLITQGLIVIDPGQPTLWYRLTRRAADLHTRADVEAFRKGRILPDDLVPPIFAQKVVPLFRRGDYDVAVFQAFKAVEVAVRRVANSKGAGYLDSDVGVPLMRKAFHPESGPLTDTSVVVAEREAVMHLFSGAMGHARNPTGHQDVVIAAQEGARLIVFARACVQLRRERIGIGRRTFGVSDTRGIRRISKSLTLLGVGPRKGPTDATYFGLRDDQWGRIKDILPGRDGHVGGTAAG